MGAELFHAGGQTDTTKLIVAFRNVVNAPKKKGVKEEFLLISIKAVMSCVVVNRKDTIDAWL